MTPDLDPEEKSNFRPVSNLHVVAIVMESIFNKQLQRFLDLHNILSVHQSGFQNGHSPETTLLDLWEIVLKNADNHTLSLMILLNFSAAFDTVERAILLRCLNKNVGAEENTLLWISAFLVGGTQQVRLEEFGSQSSVCGWGIPQGSLLSPSLFNLYPLDLLSSMSKHTLLGHTFMTTCNSSSNWRMSLGVEAPLKHVIVRSRSGYKSTI